MPTPRTPHFASIADFERWRARRPGQWQLLLGYGLPVPERRAAGLQLTLNLFRAVTPQLQPGWRIELGTREIVVQDCVFAPDLMVVDQHDRVRLVADTVPPEGVPERRRARRLAYTRHADINARLVIAEAVRRVEVATRSGAASWMTRTVRGGELVLHAPQLRASIDALYHGVQVDEQAGLSRA